MGNDMEKQKRVKMLNINCNKCSCQLNSWDARISKVLAYKIPVCEKCIAEEYDVDVDVLRGRMEHYFGMLPCLGL